MKYPKPTAEDWIIVRLLIESLGSGEPSRYDVLKSVLYMGRKLGVKQLGDMSDALNGRKSTKETTE